MSDCEQERKRWAIDWRKHRHMLPANLARQAAGYVESGKQLWVHCDLQLDPRCALVLGLDYRGTDTPLPGRALDSDVAYTLVQVLEICDAEQGRIAELEIGIEHALDALAYARESDSLDAREGARAEAERILQGVL